MCSMEGAIFYCTPEEKESCMAEEFKSFDVHQWKNLIWSDGCYVHLDDHSGHVYVTCHADEEYNENCVIPTFKQSSMWVMVWGCIMKGRKGPLAVLEYPGGRGGGMTGQRYMSSRLIFTLSITKWRRRDLKSCSNRMAHRAIQANWQNDGLWIMGYWFFHTHHLHPMLIQ